MPNKPLKRAVEIAPSVSQCVSWDDCAASDPIDVRMTHAEIAAEISDAVRPLRDAAREYLDYMSAEEPETYGDEEKKLAAALKGWEDCE